jgi:hypothetical protein
MGLIKLKKGFAVWSVELFDLLSEIYSWAPKKKNKQIKPGSSNTCRARLGRSGTTLELGCCRRAGRGQFLPCRRLVIPGAVVKRTNPGLHENCKALVPWGLI